MQQWRRSSAWIAIRTRGNPTSVGPAVAAAVNGFDPDIAVTNLLTIKELRATDMGSERRMLRLMGGFAFAAVLISAIGLYGLISYSVAQRMREFGIRLALGAQRGALLRLVLAQGLRVAAVGGGLGILAAIGGLRVMRTLLFGVSPGDPLTLVGVAILICIVALLATLVPARRATLVDPVRSLREE
jgi:ABC-type antimicrobial peptide transport system permease subunit